MYLSIRKVTKTILNNGLSNKLDFKCMYFNINITFFIIIYYLS